MSSKDKNEKEKENGNENENWNENENDETLMSSKDDDDNENENGNENDKTLMSSNDDNEIIKTLLHSSEYAEIMNQIKKNVVIKQLNDHLDKIIDKSKSFEDQIESLEKVENLEEYYFINDFGDKELESKIFILKPHTVIWTNIWSYTWNISK